MNEMLQGVKTLHKMWAKTFEATIQLGKQWHKNISHSLPAYEA